MRGTGWKKRTAALGSVAALFLLLCPFPIPPEGLVWRALGGSAHVGLFAGLAWLVGRALPPARRGWILWTALVLFSAGVEWLQPHMGRSAELVDWLYGAGGAACICGTWHLRWPRGIRWAGVLALCLFSPVWELTMVRMETHAFPVLATPGDRWASRGWSLNGVRLSMVSGKEFRFSRTSRDGEGGPVSFPGVFRAPACPDWRGTKAFHADLFWPSGNSAVFAIRVDDRPGNPPYSERFQREFAVTQGWNSVEIPAEELDRTSGGRPLQLGMIRQWGVFLVSDIPFDYFLLGVVRLELHQEQP